MNPPTTSSSSLQNPSATINFPIHEITLQQQVYRERKITSEAKQILSPLLFVFYKPLAERSISIAIFIDFLLGGPFSLIFMKSIINYYYLINSANILF
jgi:hypothetical protein